jgi:cytochrome c551/c552
MIKQLKTSIRLLALCTISLIIVIVILLLTEKQNIEPVSSEEEQDPNTEINLKATDSISQIKHALLLEGEIAFRNAGCNTCHDVCKKKVGPALKGVTKRRTREWIDKAVKNFALLRSTGDKTANDLYAEYRVDMPVHDFLKDEDLNKILFYIDSSSCK